MNETLNSIFSRCSVRHYLDKPVPKEMLETLVRAGMAAPTAVNKRPWQFIAISERPILDELAGRLPYAVMLKTATAAIIVCGDMSKALKGWEQEFWVQDCSAATQNILLAANSLGLGTVWTAAFPALDRVHIVRDVLKIPEHIIPLNVIPVGWPAGDDRPRDKWNPEALHWEKWTD